MKWVPVVTEGGTLPPELAKKIREWGITGLEDGGGRVIEADTPFHYYLQGLAAAGIEGATTLDSALTRFDRVKIAIQTKESDEAA